MDSVVHHTHTHLTPSPPYHTPKWEEREKVGTKIGEKNEKKMRKKKNEREVRNVFLRVKKKIGLYFVFEKIGLHFLFVLLKIVFSRIVVFSWLWSAQLSDFGNILLLGSVMTCIIEWSFAIPHNSRRKSGSSTTGSLPPKIVTWNPNWWEALRKKYDPKVKEIMMVVVGGGRCLRNFWGNRRKGSFRLEKLVGNDCAVVRIRIALLTPQGHTFVPLQ